MPAFRRYQYRAGASLIVPNSTDTPARWWLPGKDDCAAPRLPPLVKSRPGIAHTVDRLDETGEIVEQLAGVEDFELTHPYPGAGAVFRAKEIALRRSCAALVTEPSILELTQARRGLRV